MFGGFNPKEFLQEVVERMTEEFDYRKEAANQQYFADQAHFSRAFKSAFGLTPARYRALRARALRY